MNPTKMLHGGIPTGIHNTNHGLVILMEHGPEAGRAGYDQILQGEAGLMSCTGPPGQPSKVGVAISAIPEATSARTPGNIEARLEKVG